MSVKIIISFYKKKKKWFMHKSLFYNLMLYFLNQRQTSFICTYLVCKCTEPIIFLHAIAQRIVYALLCSWHWQKKLFSKQKPQGKKKHQITVSTRGRWRLWEIKDLLFAHLLLCIACNIDWFIIILLKYCIIALILNRRSFMT